MGSILVEDVSIAARRKESERQFHNDRFGAEHDIRQKLDKWYRAVAAGTDEGPLRPAPPADLTCGPWGVVTTTSPWRTSHEDGGAAWVPLRNCWLMCCRTSFVRVEHA